VTRPVDIGELETIAGWFARVAESLDRVATVYGDAIDGMRAEQQQLREDLGALSNRIESLARVVSDRSDRLA
jgi:hypothetical protein